MKHPNTLIYKIIAAAAMMLVAACPKPSDTAKEVQETVPTTELLELHCGDYIGGPRVEKITDRVWLAIGYDLASVVLVNTDDGNVIIDTAMSPKRARLIKEALAKETPQAPITNIIYTHSHIDHIGGASEFVEENTRIWATDAFTDHFFKQYGMFGRIETIRGRRQFGDHISLENLPCSSLGRRTDIGAAVENGVRLPTHTFSGKKVLDIGGVTFELIEAHGETHDQLIVWIPGEDTLIAADDFYNTFPNLYTLRGTSPRPVNEWIKSIDVMRAKNPEHLVPMHTIPIHGKAKVAETLTNYRDSIQWVRDAVVRGANRGDDIDTLVDTIGLPPHLAAPHCNKELYGQVSWSVRAIYSNELGWFDGRADKVYPISPKEAAKREVTLMGGPEKIIQLAKSSIDMDDTKWAIHLLAKLNASGLAAGDLSDTVDDLLVTSYEKLATTVSNTNGRGYLLESAYEIRNGFSEPRPKKATEYLVSHIPLDTIFNIMAVRLIPEKAMDVHECVHFVFPDANKRYIVTIRNGIAEIVEGDPLPGTPEPVAVLTTDSQTYVKMALGLTSPAIAVTLGKFKVKGSLKALVEFQNRFQTGI